MQANRHENKFIISKIQYENLKLCIRDMTSLDRGAAYWVRSIYFDTILDDDWKDKIIGTSYRKKVRLRIYSIKDSVAKFEVKEKQIDRTLKTSVLVNREIAEKLSAGKYSEIENVSERDILFNKFFDMIKYENRQPIVKIDYFREAYTYPVGNVRITFDYDIRASQNTNVYQYDKGIPVLSGNNIVLEVKYDYECPTVFKSILNSLDITQTSMSKYCCARNIYW